MNIIDYILIGIVFVCALIGFATGMLRQLCGLFRIIFSLFVGYLFYKKTGNLLLLPVVVIATGIIFSVIVYIIRKVHRGWQKEKPKTSLFSRVGGGLTGGFKGMALACIALICMYLFTGVFIGINPAISEYVENSYFHSCLKQRNLLPATGVLRNIYFAGKLLNEDLIVELSENSEIISRLRKNPSIRAILKDEKLQQSIQNKDYKELFSNPKFLKLFKDKDFLNQIYSIDYEDIYNKQKLGREK